MTPIRWIFVGIGISLMAYIAAVLVLLARMGDVIASTNDTVQRDLAYAKLIKQIRGANVRPTVD